MPRHDVDVQQEARSRNATFSCLFTLGTYDFALWLRMDRDQGGVGSIVSKTDPSLSANGRIGGWPDADDGSADVLWQDCSWLRHPDSSPVNPDPTLLDYTLADPQLDVPPRVAYAADDFTGSGYAIAIIDSGFSPYYDQSNTVFATDFFGSNDPDARIDTLNSHGSWVAQVAVDTAKGIDIVHLKVFSDYGGGAYLGDVDEALDWVIDNADAYNIVALNLSLGYSNTQIPTYTGLSNRFAQLDAAGIVAVAAAGNAGRTYPDGVSVIAADPSVVAVSALDENGTFASFSQRSPALTDIAAPGVDVNVSTIYGPPAYSVSGSSFAAPYVAASVALLQEAANTIIRESLTDEQIVQILQSSGDDVAGFSDPSAPEGYAVADANAALEYFIANYQDYQETTDMFLA